LHPRHFQAALELVDLVDFDEEDEEDAKIVSSTNTKPAAGLERPREEQESKYLPLSEN
jgi:hypothetical protein